jgi:hypothetical protein
MKLVLFTDNRPGLLKDDVVVDLSEIIRPLGASNGQEAMEATMTHIDDLAGELSRLQQEGEVLPLPRLKKMMTSISFTMRQSGYMIGGTLKGRTGFLGRGFFSNVIFF